MIFLYIFLGIILFFLVLLCCPVFVNVSFRNSLRLKVKFLFFSFDLLPRKELSKISKEENFIIEEDKIKSDLVNNKFFSIIKERGFFGFLKILKQILEILISSAKKILKKIHISSFDLYLLVASENAAKTAINYGKVYAFISYAESILLSNVAKSNYHIEVIPGFDESEPKVDFSSKFHFFPIFMLGILFGSLYGFLKNIFLNLISERV